MIIKASAGTHVGDSLPEIDCTRNAATAEILCRRHVFSLVALEGDLYLASGRLVAELGAAEATIRKRFACFGRETTADLIAIREADIRGSGYQTAFVAERWRRIFHEMQEQRAPFSESELNVSGEDIMRELGLKAGERVGRIKHALLLRCAVHPEENERKILLKRMHDCQ